jgi:hypothetical protein
MSSAFVHLLASHKPRANSLASIGAGDAGMHTTATESKLLQDSRQDQINMVFDSLRNKYGMLIDRAEVRLEADACSEAAYRGLHGHTTQLDAPLDVKEYTCSDAVKQAKLLAVSNDSAVTSVFPIYVICQGSACVSDVSLFPIYRRRRSV